MSEVCASELKGIERTEALAGLSKNTVSHLGSRLTWKMSIAPSTESAHRGDVEWLEHDRSLLARLRAVQVQVQPVRSNYATRPVQRDHCLRKDRRYLLRRS